MLEKKGQKDSDLNLFQLMISGVFAGLFQTTITFPLEFIRTRLSLSIVLRETKYKGIIHCATHTYRTEGIFAFYKGYFATMVSGSPYVGLQMTSYEMFKRYIPTGMYIFPNTPEGGIIHKLICGALSGLVAQTITYPGDTVRRRMISNGISGRANHYKHTLDCCVQMYRHEGIKSFFSGATTNVVRCLPGAAIQFAAFEQCKILFGIYKS